ncbi:MAG: type II toxin-antitoxin system prevent-host-death family antitoxin [Acidobacteria bacterium]|nr:type II toxin-antitoxin system prevent-host-death family antitoxin [Acidobacteriota bacterium]MBK8314008.1 type II toxin-antitoxin system prevent-host-death family antitoxin [Acidobacteriota bacterium]MBK9709067.1 type II toxin-antitoxin system prevent-host-death family antitoxin [Acidobacteriota bacterium]
MKAVNIAELKNRLSHYLNEVRGGAEILIKDRDLPIARIVPLTFDDQDQEIVALAAREKVRLGEGVIGEEFWEMPSPKVSAEALRRAVKEERDDAR